MTLFKRSMSGSVRTGERATSFDRELYIDCDGPRDTWVTELQTVLEPRP